MKKIFVSLTLFVVNFLAVLVVDSILVVSVSGQIVWPFSGVLHMLD